MSREIGDIAPIRDSDKLVVYFYKEDSFFTITSQNFLKFFPKGSKCRTCPTFYVKYTGKKCDCVAKMENFSTFKCHLAESERIFGELLAFKTNNELPDKSIFKKHRLYGYLWPYISPTKNEFLMFDTRKKKFIKVERKNITRTYTKKGICNFCPCNRKLQSCTTVIKHLQVLETRFYCYLILDDEKYNDKRNQERLNNYLKAIETKEINRPVQSKRPTHTSLTMNNPLADDLEDMDEFDESTCLTDTDKAEETMISVLNEFEKSIEQSFFHMNDYIDQLRNKANSVIIDQAVIDTQDQLNLIKRNEDFKEKEKELTFHKEVNLKFDDISYLMNRYLISDEYEISKSEFILNVQLKEEPEILAEAKSRTANSSISNGQVTKRLSFKKTPIRTTKDIENKEVIENDDKHYNQSVSLGDKSQNASVNYVQLKHGSPIKIFEFDNVKIKRENCLDECDDLNVFKRTRYD